MIPVLVALVALAATVPVGLIRLRRHAQTQGWKL